ncbi:hypothetical protein H8356DRAFT_951005 [Neocallimastix lanati (nom. inval.)]|uniref:Uncharacterized protein n=1 Tax=Neocallimastix californiae TaxID=1754190 RepID=A0A1Y2ASG3_9FUNG|nr:hypothetical protein H8356DRAFT_951005 [Neocallimastix sp. JGI-2020a]ORY25147.1 hypothetical protein LY90DRAFT_514308 [Neocallimastix californiae]|eukprot:ORY25147.1 hypothetical protein LY90DRAFT_514308 [Neocallimastix californiae]
MNTTIKIYIINLFIIKNFYWKWRKILELKKVQQIEEKSKLLTENINLIFQMKRKIIQRYIDALNIELQINVNLIILNDKMEFLEYESLHNHLEKEYEASKSIVK